MAISTPGIGTNLDLQNIYDQIKKYEDAKLAPLEQTAGKYEAKLKAFSALRTALSTMQAASAKIADIKIWNATKVTSSNNGFSATTGSGATPGSYSVQISNLAKAHNITFNAIADKTTPLGDTTGGTRTISITQPGTKTPLEVTLGDGDTSLDGIAKAINNANGNVTASVVKAKDGEYHLMLSSKTTGTDGEMTISVNGDPKLDSIIGSGAPKAKEIRPENARLEVNGITIERQSNTVSDVLPGVTLTLKSVTSSAETLNIESETGNNKTLIEEWVSAYNSLQSVIGTLTKYEKPIDNSAQSANNGALISDGTMRSIKQKLNNTLLSMESGSVKRLADLGIKLVPNTQEGKGVTDKLEIDSKKLLETLEKNPSGVQEFFVGDGKDTGSGTRLNNMLKGVLETAAGKEGEIELAKNSLDKASKEIVKRYESMQNQIDKTMENYKKQFSSLSKLVAQMDNMGKYLTQQFNPKG